MDDVQPLLRARFSPTEFDRSHVLGAAELELLVEAARWAPSAGNSQPWLFWVAPRDSDHHRSLVPALAPSARRWAPDASVLVVNLVRRYVDEPGFEYSEFADYDLGQAVAHMTIQAGAIGLGCRQFRAFDLAAVTEAVRPDVGWEVRTITAIGRPSGTPAAARARLPLEQVAPNLAERD